MTKYYNSINKFVLITACAFSTCAQAGDLTYRFSGVYQVGAANMLLHNNYNLVTADSLNSYSVTRKEEGVYGSMGQGLSYGLAVGYQPNPTLGFEMAFSYLQSNPYPTHYFYMRTFYGGEWYSYNNKSQLSGSAMSLCPSIKICTKAWKAIPYFRLGLVFALCSRQNDIQMNVDSKKYGSFHVIAKEVYENSYTIGTQSALGFSYPVTDGFSIGAEINMTNLTTNFLSSELVSYTENGNDYLKLLPISRRKTEYLEHYDVSVISPNAPRRELLEPTPFSSYGFGISLIFKINTKADAP